MGCLPHFPHKFKNSFCIWKVLSVTVLLYCPAVTDHRKHTFNILSHMWAVHGWMVHDGSKTKFLNKILFWKHHIEIKSLNMCKEKQFFSYSIIPPGDYFLLDIKINEVLFVLRITCGHVIFLMTFSMPWYLSFDWKTLSSRQFVLLFKVVVNDKSNCKI